MASNRKLSTAGCGRARDKGDASKRPAKVAAHFEYRGGGRGITRRRIAYFFFRAAIFRVAFGEEATLCSRRRVRYPIAVVALARLRREFALRLIGDHRLQMKILIVAVLFFAGSSFAQPPPQAATWYHIL
jgi:hypothetical protein